MYMLIHNYLFSFTRNQFLCNRLGNIWWYGCVYPKSANKEIDKLMAMLFMILRHGYNCCFQVQKAGV